MSRIELRLRELRQAKGLSQVQLAELTGIDQGAISRIETGQTQAMDFDVMARLCDALGCDPGELLQIVGKPKKRSR